MQIFSFEIQSQLNANPAQVWQDIFNMKAVNRELSPFVRMTYPENFDWTKQMETKQVLFSSWILLFGFIPVDQHFLRFEEIKPGEGFHEYSYSIMHHFWRHKRTLEAKDEKTILKDEVEFAPQTALFGPVLREIYKVIFRKRHQHLRRKYI
ncbi:MAG: hypothetical protein SFU99_13010 [Saprospiraceae bacterium]|nr:hypothetical protein [Saprospiraceae bacterium]